MSLVVVADTSPINYLLETSYIELLPILYGQVILPSAVHSELSSKGSSEIVRVWAGTPPAWISIQSPTHSVEALAAQPGFADSSSAQIEERFRSVLQRLAKTDSL